VLEESAGRFGTSPAEIHATDLSQSALNRARLGEYTALEMGRGMPAHYLERYVKQTVRKYFMISPKISSRVTFKLRNLLEPCDSLGQLEMVFCRKLRIFFDRAMKQNVLERIAQVIPSDGYLVLGGPETTLGLNTKFVRHPEWRSVYMRSGPSSVRAAAADHMCA